MKLRYIVEHGDLAGPARMKLHYSVRQRALIATCVPLFFGLVFWRLVDLEGPARAVLIAACGVLSVVLWFTSKTPIFVALQNSRRAAYVCDDQCGEHIMEIVDDGLVERNEAGEVKALWRTIADVATEIDRTIVVLSNGTMMVVPSHTILEGDYAGFVDLVRLRFRESKERKA